MADIFKRNAASFIAKFEYKYHIWILEGVFFILYLFFIPSEKRDFVIIVAAFILAIIVGYVVREVVFSRLVLKKHNDEELKALWLKYGGFSEL